MRSSPMNGSRTTRRKLAISAEQGLDHVLLPLGRA